MPFHCDCDGACCRQMGKMVISCISTVQGWKEGDAPLHPIVEEIAAFPYDINEDGSCSRLNDGGFCNIYNTRPLVCNTDAMHDKYWYMVIGKDEFYANSRKSCEKLHNKERHGLNK